MLNKGPFVLDAIDVLDHLVARMQSHQIKNRADAHAALVNTSGVLMNRQKISIIVAMAQNRTIGINNTLPWRCPEDLKHFKSLTMGHHMIMGRKTYDSIGKPLPGRTTVVVTRNPELEIDGCIVTRSLEEAIAACSGDKEVFIVGGAELYAQAMPLVDTLYVTEIQQDVDGDAHFPAFRQSEWHEVAREPRIQESPQPLQYHFVTFQRTLSR